jgi:uncharacterized protein YydD (DUF2326 family)
MRLISLTANQDSFHPVTFHSEGITLVLAKQKNPEQSDAGKTTNGVGKSLIVTIIHFCLGSNENQKLAKAIPGWEFTLAFDLGDTRHTASRNVDRQDVIVLDGQGTALGKYRDFLEKECFAIPDGSRCSAFDLLLSDLFAQVRMPILRLT